MPLTPAQRANNLARIAEGAVALEASLGVPAELCSAQCILESGWLAKCIHNNPFGIKAREGEPFEEVLTTEYLTPSQLARVRKAGKTIVSVDPLKNGKHRVKMKDRFRAFDSLADAFVAYGTLLIQGRYFAARFKSYRQHGSLTRLLEDMSGADGMPPYATDPNYAAQVQRLYNQKNVRDALASARHAALIPA